jgi:hypothetical protein
MIIQDSIETKTVLQELNLHEIRKRIDNQLILDSHLEELKRCDADLVDGKPTIVFLRALVEAIYGKISGVETYCQQIDGSNGFYGKTSVTILAGEGGASGPNKYITRTGYADATEVNTQPPFDKYLCAIASIRSESRAYRSLLNLRTISAEESDASSDMVTGKPQSMLLNLLSSLCSKKGLDVTELAKKKFKKLPQELTEEEAQILYNDIKKKESD